MKPGGVAVAVKAGIFYFVVVFGAGFVLGPVRLLWAVPRFGARVAELMEMPVMLAVVIVAARTVVRRLQVPPGPACRLVMGAVALALLLGAELALVLPLRGLSPREYVTQQDPVSGLVFLGVLVAFAVTPVLVARRGDE